jgi:hypothetical protein
MIDPEVGGDYYNIREHYLADHKCGLTELYNHFHENTNTDIGILNLRKSSVELDCAVAAAYGWSDLDLGHDFHPTKQGIRFTIAEAARREVLDRLLALNHERSAAEQLAVFAAPRPKAKPRKRAPDQAGLF